MAAPLPAIFPVHSGLLPHLTDVGPRAYMLELDFAAATTYDFDMVTEDNSGQINTVQALFVDNADNGQAVTLKFGNTKHRLIIPPQSQAIVPVFTAKNPRCHAASGGGVLVPVYLLNVPLPFAVWQTAALSVSVSTPTGTFTDRSGTITLAGTSQQLLAANANRKRWFVFNPVNAVANLYINFGALAAAVNGGSSVAVPPGSTYDSLSGPVHTGIVNITGNSTGQAFVAKEM